MIPKLDKLILRTFIGPFIATFFVALFVVVLQFFWKYIDELVGKGVDIWFLLKLIGIVALQSGVLFALPIAILLASLMTFGNLAESFELLAIKSSGISLLRFMRPIFVFVLFVCGLAFVFNNFVIPKANLKFYTILTDIRTSKPSFDLKEGTFYSAISGIAIQVEKKDDNTGELKNVIIYENNANNFQDNFIVAESGKMAFSEDKKGLEFTLRNGERVQEKGKAYDQNTELYRIQFKELKKTFDISELMMKQTEDSLNKGFYKMLNLSQLSSNMDSLKKHPERFSKKAKTSLSSSLSFFNKNADSFWSAKNTIVLNRKVKRFSELMPDSVKNLLSPSASEKLSNAKSQLEMDLFEYNSQADALRFHKMEWHRKFSFSVISIIMFLIGAPLGAIIRRGGLGTPLVLALVFFVIYFILSSSGEKSANAKSLTPFVGMWLPILVLLPVGFWFTLRARKDKGVINTELIIRGTSWIAKQFKAIVGLIKSKSTRQKLDMS